MRARVKSYHNNFISQYSEHRGEVGSGAPGEQSTQVNGEWSCGPVTNAEGGDWSRRGGVGGFTHRGPRSHQEAHSGESCGTDFCFHRPRGTSAGGGGRGAKQSEVSLLRFSRLDSDWCGRPDVGHLGADAQVAVGDELWLLVAVLLLLQEGVEHAHADAWQSHQEGQNLPSLGCQRRNVQESARGQSKWTGTIQTNRNRHT